MNEHASAVLDVYLGSERHAVAHAVLIEGRWGSGKTHFIQQIYEPRRLERLGRRHVPFLYVSLFGAKSAQDVEMRIFKAACPGEAVAGSIAGTIALGIGEFLQAPETVKGTLSAISKRAIRRLNEHVFVLDDLERVEPGVLGEVMGLVASFVGTHDRRVILVADEDEVRKRFPDYDWDRRAEKVIGRRAAIEPAFADVLKYFTRALPEGKVRNAFRQSTSDLLDVVGMSGTQNLRNLSWALHNASRFADVLLSDDDIPSEHVIRTIGIVVATSLWSRSRQTDRATFENLPELAILIQMDSHGMRSRAEGEKGSRRMPPVSFWKHSSH